MVAHPLSTLPPDVRRKVLEPVLLNLTKANSRATVQRGSYLDYVGIKRFDARRPAGRRAAFPRAVPEERGQAVAVRHPDRAAEDAGRAGPRGRPAARLRGAGARRHPGQLPAGRAPAVRGRRPVQRRHRDPRAAAPAAAAAAGPPRRLRAVLLLLRRPAARPAHRGGPRAHPRHADDGVPRRARRGVDARHRLGRRPPALRDLHRARRRARPRHGDDRGTARLRPADVDRRSRRRARRGVRRGTGRAAPPPVRERVAVGIPGRPHGPHRGERHPPARGAAVRRRRTTVSRCTSTGRTRRSTRRPG